jgi:hypothetical protein
MSIASTGRLDEPESALGAAGPEEICEDVSDRSLALHDGELCVVGQAAVLAVDHGDLRALVLAFSEVEVDRSADPFLVRSITCSDLAELLTHPVIDPLAHHDQQVSLGLDVAVDLAHAQSSRLADVTDRQIAETAPDDLDGGRFGGHIRTLDGTFRRLRLAGIMHDPLLADVLSRPRSGGRGISVGA